MMIKTLMFPLILMVSLTTVDLQAQGRLTVYMGYGGYFMQDMKNLQNEFTKGLPVEIKKTSSFPPYVNYKLGITKRFRPSGLLIGVNFGYGSTGARVDYRDFSGSITGDILVSYFSFSTTLGISKSSTDEKWLWYFDLQPELMRSTLKVITAQSLQGNASNESNTFQSLNFNIQPIVGAVRTIGKYGIVAYIGFNIGTVNGKLKFSENRDAYLLTPESEPAKTDWTGLRMGVGISYNISN